MKGEKKNSIYDFAYSLLRLIDSRTRFSTLIDGVIKEVDETKYTCSVTCGSSEFSNVPLRVLIGSQASFIEIPKIGTNCIISFRDNNVGRPQIVGVHQTDKILINCDNIVFNEGSNGAIPTGAIVDKVNQLENDLNTLKQVFTAWTPVPTDGGAALKAASAVWSANQIPVTVKADVTNDKIKI